MSSAIAAVSSSVSGGFDVVVNRAKFAAALAAAAHAAEGKPGEQMVRFFCQADRREFHVFNRDVTVTMDVSDAVDVDSISIEGSAMLPIQRMGRLFSDLHHEEVRITRVQGFTDATGGKLLIKWSGGECAIQVAGVEKYPPCDQIEDPWDFISIDPLDLLSGLRSALVSVDSGSPGALAGLRLDCNLDCNDGKMDFVGTDGREMSVSTSEVVVTNKAKDGCVMAERGAVVACKILEWAYPDAGGDYSPVAIVISESRVMFDLRGPRRCMVSVRLIDGRYPRYQDLLDKIDTSYQQMEVCVDQLVSALRQAAIVLGPESIGVQLDLAPDMCRVSAQTPEVGTATIESSFSNVTQPVTVVLDLRRLLLAAQCIPRGAKVSFLVKNRESFVSMRHKAFQFILMPIGK